MSARISFWSLLVLGVMLRCVALNQPLVDAHMMRQCQTAAVTKGLITEPGLSFSTKIPWLGDIDARFVLELPIYNYLVIGIHQIVGNLDVSGKLTSILLWAASFAVLQGIWRRLLNRDQTFWANLLFVFAPLEVFYGQAFMPEMLVQLLAFAFLLLALRYDEGPALSRWVACALVGSLALLVKLPEVAHLFLVLAFLVVRRTGWRSLFSPRYLIAGLMAAGAVKLWANYLESVNSEFLPEWGSEEYLKGFIGSLESRFQIKPWAMIGLYLGAFVFPGPAVLATIYGGVISFRKRLSPILIAWLVSVAAFYLVWFGNAGTAQNYYNLPAVAPICALFGIGMHQLLSGAWVRRLRPMVVAASVAAVVLPAVPVWRYLFTQDRHFLDVAKWIRENTNPTDVVLFRPNHHWAVVNYPYSPAVAYYSDRPTFVWTGFTQEEYRRAAVERSRFALVTIPPPPPTGVIAWLNRFRGVADWQPEPVDWLEAAGFTPVAREERFTAYKKLAN